MAQLIFVSAAQVRELQARYERLFAQDTAEQPLKRLPRF